MDLKDIFRRISSPEQLTSALGALEGIKIPKLTNNIIKDLRSVISTNNKDLKQFNGLSFVYKILFGGLKFEFTDADWFKMHAEFGKLVIYTFESFLMYTKTSIIHENTFCALILQFGKLLLPIVYRIDFIRHYIIQEGYYIILTLITLEELNFKIRKDLFACVKPILVKTDSKQRKFILKNLDAYLPNVAKMVVDCGDYETQEGLIEILMRLSLVSPHKINKMAHWFQPHISDSKLTKILDYQNYDVSCREFLNALNMSIKSDVKVITLPCFEAYANDILLKKPNAEKYQELWVDFSVSTGVIHMVCDCGGNSWLRLSIEQGKVKKITCFRRAVKNISPALQLLIELVSPLQVLLHSVENHITTLKLLFLMNPQVDVLREIFFPRCYEEVFEEENTENFYPVYQKTTTVVDAEESPKVCLKKLFCDNSSISTIHSSSAIPKLKRGEEFVTPNSKMMPQPKKNCLVTSTPKIPPHTRPSMRDILEKSEAANTSNLTLLCQSDHTNNEFLFNRLCNTSNKTSIIKHARDSTALDEDKKFKELCEKRLQNKSLLLWLPQSSSQKQADKFKNDISNKLKKDHCEIPDSDKAVTLFEQNEKVKEIKLRENNQESGPSEEESPFILTSSKTVKHNETVINTSATNTPINVSLSKRNAEKNEEDGHSNFKKIKQLFTESWHEGNKLDFLSEKASTSITSMRPQPQGSKTFFLQPSKLNFIKSNNLMASASGKASLTMANKDNRIINNQSLLFTKDGLITANNQQRGILNDSTSKSQNISFSIVDLPTKVKNKPSEEQKVKKVNISASTEKTDTKNVVSGNSGKGVEFILSSECASSKSPCEIKVTKTNFICDKSGSRISSGNCIQGNYDKKTELEKLNPMKSSSNSEQFNICIPSDAIDHIKKGLFLKNGLNLAHSRHLKDNTESQIEMLLKNKEEQPTCPLSSKLNYKFEKNKHRKSELSTKTINKKAKFGSITKNKRPNKRKMPSVFDWQSSASFSDEEEGLFNKLISKNKKGDSLKNKSCSKKDGCDLESDTSEVFTGPLANSSDKNKIPQDRKSPSPNSFHCRLPNKTYLSKNKPQSARKSTSEKIFENLKMNKKGQSISQSSDKTPESTGKRKLFNHGDSFEVLPNDHGGDMVQSPDFSYLTADDKKPKTADDKKVIKFRRSLRLKARTQVKYNTPEYSWEKQYTKSEPEQMYDKSKNNEDDTGNSNLQQNYEDGESEEIVRKSNTSRKSINASPGTSFQKPDDKNISEREPKERPDRLKSPLLTKKKKEYIKEKDNKRADFKLFIASTQLIDPIREESHCDLSLQGVPAEEDVSDESLLELEEPPLRLSTDNSSATKSCQEMEKNDTIGTQADTRAELYFLDTVIENLGKLALEAPKKKILTEVGSLDMALNKMELYTKSSNKDFARICLEVKEYLTNALSGMEKMVSSCDSFINSFLLKTSDIKCTMTRLSKNVEHDQDIKLKFIKDLEKLCKERRNVVREENFF